MSHGYADGDGMWRYGPHRYKIHKVYSPTRTEDSFRVEWQPHWQQVVVTPEYKTSNDWMSHPVVFASIDAAHEYAKRELDCYGFNANPVRHTHSENG